MADNIEVNNTRETTATKIDNIYNKPPVIEIDNTDIALKQDKLSVKDSKDIASSDNNKIKGKNDSSYDKRLANLKPAQPGERRNPSGRPKVPDEAKAMLKAAAPEAVRLLVATLRDPKTRTDLRIKCGEIVLDRVYGKAVQPIDGLVENAIQIVFAPTVKSWGD